MKVLNVEIKDLKHNINIIKKYLNLCHENENVPKIIGVVKANGYGLDLVKFSRFLVNEGIDILAVSSVEEAIELRENDINTEILLLAGTSDKEELEELLKNNIILTISSFEDLNSLKEIVENNKGNSKTNIKVHLKIDTGFNRYGFKYEEIEHLADELKKCDFLKIEGIFSHFSYAYSKKEDYTRKQFEEFRKIIKKLNELGIDAKIKHICNSSAFVKYPEFHLDAVRIGSGFLGRLQIENEIGFKKVGTFISKISEIKKVKKNEFIGYSNSERAKKDMTIAIIPAGYSDGVNFGKQNDTFKLIDKIRILKNSFEDIFKDKHLYVFVKNYKCRVVGKVGMNHTVIDITGKDIKIGDKVEFNISPLNISDKVRREYS